MWLRWPERGLHCSIMQPLRGLRCLQAITQGQTGQNVQNYFMRQFHQAACSGSIVSGMVMQMPVTADLLIVVSRCCCCCCCLAFYVSCMGCRTALRMDIDGRMSIHGTLVGYELIPVHRTDIYRANTIISMIGERRTVRNEGRALHER